MTDIMCWQIRNFLGPRLDSVVFHISYFVFLWHSSPPAGSFWAWHWFLFVFVFLWNSSALLRWAMALGEENALIDLLLRSDGFCLYFYSYLYFCLHLYCICIYNCMKFLHPSWGELWLWAGQRHFLSNLASPHLLPLCCVVSYAELYYVMNANTKKYKKIKGNTNSI